MKKIREVLRLKYEKGLSQRKIAQSISVGYGTVWDYLHRATKVGLSWPLPKEIDDISLEKLLFPDVKSEFKELKPIPDYDQIHKELKRKGVTLLLLWEEYFQIHPNGYRYSHFCDLYRQWAEKRDVWMPQQHKAGEKIFVDYAGVTIPIFNSDGSQYEAQIFVGTLGASNYTFAEATKTQQLHDWIGSHVRMFYYFGGCSKVLVPDNLKSGVKLPHLYDPDLNPTYLEMAAHYGIAVIPTRVRAPKDKSKVEKGVQDVETQVLARLRNKQFFSLEELNEEISRELGKFNRRPFQKLPGCRLSHFEELDKPNLNPLPATPYFFAEWQKKRVGKNYHINVLGHYYSIPYLFVKEEVEARITENTIEVFFKNNRIASHLRSNEIGKYTTNHKHRPQHHQFYADCTPENLLLKANKVGEDAKKWVQTVLDDESRHPIVREKICLGVLRLIKSYDESRLDLACKRALQVGIFNCRSIESMLKAGLDQLADQEPKVLMLPQNHEFVRGSAYYI
jgi:transposase